MTQMIEHAHKKDELEFAAETSNLVDVQFTEFDVGGIHLGGEPRLREIGGVGIDSDHECRTAPFHFQRVEAGVAAYIEDSLAGEIGWQRVSERAPFALRIVAEKMMRRSLHARQFHVLEPVPQLVNAPLDVLWLPLDARCRCGHSALLRSEERRVGKGVD